MILQWSTGSVWDVLYIRMHLGFYIQYLYAIQYTEGEGGIVTHSILCYSGRVVCLPDSVGEKEGSLLVHWWAVAQQCIQGKREVCVHLHALSGSDMLTPPPSPFARSHQQPRHRKHYHHPVAEWSNDYCCINEEETENWWVWATVDLFWLCTNSAFDMPSPCKR